MDVNTRQTGAWLKANRINVQELNFIPYEIELLVLFCRFAHKLAYKDDPYESKRINLETKNTQNNFWHTETWRSQSTNLQPKVNYAPYTRLNQPRLDYK